MSLGDRLKDARTTLGLKQVQVADSTGLGASTISDFENGSREPNIAQLKRLAALYRRSMDYFLADREPAPEIVLWRERPQSPTAEELQCRLLTLAEQYHTLEVLCDERRVHELPKCDVRRESFDSSHALLLASNFRKTLGLGDRPGSALLSVLEEDCKVKVFHVCFDPLGSAACTISPESGASILLNAKHVRTQRNSDLAHELFHLLTWAVFRSGDVASEKKASENEESLANLFAGDLLIPEEALRTAVVSVRGCRTKLCVDDFFDLARQFDVPVDVIATDAVRISHSGESGRHDD